MPVLEARDVQLSFGATPALARRQPGRVRRGDPGGDGPERFGQVDPAALPGRHPRPDRGEIRFAGRRVDTLGEQARSTLRRDHFGFVFQFGQLVPELTAEENVALPLLLGGAPAGRGPRRGPGLVRAARPRRARAAPVRGAVRRPSPAGRPGPGPGPRPEVLFADEPTGSLDSLTGEQVMELLVAATRRQGTTVVLVTHEPRVAAYADREIVVRDGRASSLSADRVVS